MRLVIQIPCYNEEAILPETLARLPRSVEGFDEVLWLVIDDGSDDRTAQVAKQHGADRVVRLPRHQGLARAFMEGLEASLRAGANVIVNTDADNQYRADDIDRLIAPILKRDADIVVGTRSLDDSDQYGPLKKVLHRLGSWFVKKVSNTTLPDPASGFRAFSRTAARRLHVFNEYTYTLETVVQAGQKSMAITSVPIRTNPSVRPSRLISNIWEYCYRQLLTLVRIFVTYRPFPFFFIPGTLSFLVGFGISLRFLYFYITGTGAGHVQSLILSALLMGLGFFLVVTGLMADLVSVNRKLLEQIEWKLHQESSNDHQGDPPDVGHT